jgi:hypothetical protein
MIQLVLKIVSLFCKLGGPYIAPLIIPIYGLLVPLTLPLFCSLWSILCCSIFIPIQTSEPNVLNSKDGEKRFGRSLGFSLLIYYPIIVSCMCVIMQKACKVNNTINPF